MSRPDFAIVDAHFHQWDPATTPRETWPLRPLMRWPKVYRGVGQAVFPPAPRAFLGTPNVVLDPYMPRDHVRNWEGFDVDVLVHVQAGWHARGMFGPVGETRWLETLDFGPGKRLGAIVAHADLQHPRVDETLAAHHDASRKLRGIRHMGAHHPARGVMKWTRHANLFQRSDFLRGFEQLARTPLSFDAWVYSHQLDDVTALAKRFPQTPIVLDHLGTPVAAAGSFASLGATEREREAIRARWRDDLARLSEQRNVHVKLSGLTMPLLGFGFHQRAEPPSVEALCEGLRPFIEHGIACFGVERCIWASNFPMDSVSAPLSHLVEAYLQLIAPSGPAATRAIFRDNALRFYRIDP